MLWTRIFAAAVGLICLVSLGWAAALRLRRAYVRRLESRYFDRWAALSLSQKEQVLSGLGVVLWPHPQHEDPDLAEARLNDLFLTVLAGNARDLGLGPLTQAALPLSLLDVEMEWAFAQSLARKKKNRP